MSAFSKFLVLASLAAVAPFGSEASAQAVPARQITIVVPFAAGGSTDTMARMSATHLGKALGQNVIVENKPGAGGDLAAEYVSKAPADGSVFLFGTTSLAITQYMGTAKTYDPQKSFTPVIYVARAPNAFIVSTASGITDLKGLIAFSKTKPNGLSFASPGARTTGHFAGEWLKKQTGARLTHVPYRGSGPAVTDLLAGVVEVAADSPVSYQPHVESGKLRILAVTSKDRVSVLPNIPAVSESGYDMDVSVWFALVGPVGVPAPIVERLNKEMNAFVKLQSTRDAFAKFGAEVKGGTPNDLATLIRTESDRWRVMVETTGIKQ